MEAADAEAHASRSAYQRRFRLGWMGTAAQPDAITGSVVARVADAARRLGDRKGADTMKRRTLAELERRVVRAAKRWFQSGATEAVGSVDALLAADADYRKKEAALSRSVAALVKARGKRNG
jgi:hypothetical protein